MSMREDVIAVEVSDGQLQTPEGIAKFVAEAYDATNSAVLDAAEAAGANLKDVAKALFDANAELARRTAMFLSLLKVTDRG